MRSAVDALEAASHRSGPRRQSQDSSGLKPKPWIIYTDPLTTQGRAGVLQKRPARFRAS